MSKFVKNDPKMDKDDQKSNFFMNFWENFIKKWVKFENKIFDLKDGQKWLRFEFSKKSKKLPFPKYFHF